MNYSIINQTILHTKQKKTETKIDDKKIQLIEIHILNIL